jgi:hypothetical protein
MKQMKKLLIATTTMLALVAVLTTGCAELSTVTPAHTGEKVNFRLWISDENNDIGHFDELWVTISSVGVVQSGDGDGVIEQSINPSAEVDLTDLTEANATLLWSGELVDGDYTKVFLYVAVDEFDELLISWDPAEDPDTLEDYEITEVKLPSAKMQISKPFTISSENGQVVDFVFDITVHKAGMGGKYILTPQLAQSGPDQEIVDVRSTGKPEGTGKSEKQGELTLEIMEEDIAPGDAVTLWVTFGSEDVTNATVKVNGEELDDLTGEDGTITFTIPEDADELEIEVKKGRLEGELNREFQE